MGSHDGHAQVCRRSLCDDAAGAAGGIGHGQVHDAVTAGFEAQIGQAREAPVGQLGRLRRGSVDEIGHGDHQDAALERVDVGRGSLAGRCHASSTRQNGERNQGLFHVVSPGFNITRKFLCTSIKVFR